MKPMISSWAAWVPPSLLLALIQIFGETDVPAVAWPVVVLLVFALVRPRGWWPVVWTPTLLAAVFGAIPSPTAPGQEAMEEAFDRRCRRMETVSQQLATDPRIQELLVGAGEALDPPALFRRLDSAVEGWDAATVYLVDDRGDLVAWGGANHRFPHGLRSLGPRRFAVDWSAIQVGILVREPVFIEGRLVGAVVLSERRPLEFEGGFGLPQGARYLAGWNTADPMILRPASATNLELPLTVIAARSAESGPLPAWFFWVLQLLVTAAVGHRTVALPAALGLATGAVTDPWPMPVVALLVVAFAWGLAAALREAEWRLVRATIALAAVVVIAAILILAPGAPWLPRHLFEPGPGAAWIVALAMLAGALPMSGSASGGRSRAASQAVGRGSGRPVFGLELRLVRAAAVAAVALVLTVAQLPLRTLGGSVATNHGFLPEPGHELELGALLPDAWGQCRVDDVATALARSWFPEGSGGGHQVIVEAADGTTVSRWGDLGIADDLVDDVGFWPTGPEGGATVIVRRAAGPWALLPNWPVERGLDSVRNQLTWWAVVARSGAVAATLHSGISDIAPEDAGRLLHDGGGWLLVSVDGRPNLARAEARDGWLVVAIARSPTLATWVARGLLGVLWALVGLALVRPPDLQFDRLSTFGGRLRLLVAGGVVVPLTVLALLLQFRFSRQEALTETALGVEAFTAARYTTEHLAAGVPVDDDLATWLAQGWGGEAVLFDGPVVVAQSRPDLAVAGRLPELPSKEAFLAFSLGRAAPLVVREGHELVSAGAILLDGRPILLHLYREVPWAELDAPVAADWLLGGAVVAALVTLVFTGRIESRLSGSLRDLVELSRDLLDGRPLRPMPTPSERDIAQVLAAVQSMADEVRSRENRLREQEEMLRITLATLGPAVMVLGSDGAVRFSNPSAEALLQVEPQVMAGLLARARSGQALEPSVRPNPGRDVHWRVTSARVPLGGGEGTVVVVDDVTGVVRADRLEQLNQLARIVAHEVKNPLTPIRLWVQELEVADRDGLAPESAALLDDACREIGLQTDRLQLTANAFSNLVALEHWEPVVVDAAHLAGRALRDLAVPPGSGIKLTAEIAPGPLEVAGDPVWLRRALDTILSNSLRAVGDGGVITVRADRHDGSVRLEVEDTGGGVDTELLSELFNPRFSTTSTGTGLGLALVRQVVGRCDGTVEAANGREGLVVSLTFPLADSAGAEVG
jgi:signal transduction histidine kinase